MNESILLIDDDEQLTDILSIELESAGYEVSVCSTPHRALEIMRQKRFSTILLDLRLGDYDGLSVLGDLRELDPNVPVFMITAHGDVDSAVSAFSRGVTGYLRKPFKENEIKERVAQAVEAYSIKQHVQNILSQCGDQNEVRRIVCSRDRAMDPVLKRIAMAANVPSNVVITGESGTGKELVARALHLCGPRKSAPFVAINCAALPESLLESELFGYVRGAFTDARESKPGLFARADGGTIFLDEIGDAPLSIQTKLLRVLQEREITPIGGTTPIKVNVRVVAATHKSLRDEVAAGRFRQDLYFRLHVVPIHMPPLRERPADIAFLGSLFAAKISERLDLKFEGFTEAASQALREHAWPGNVRELQNRVEHALVLGSGGKIGVSGLFPERESVVETARSGDADDDGVVVESGPLSESESSLEHGPEAEAALPTFSEAKISFERNYLERILGAAKGNIAKAARLASKSRTEVYSLLRKHRLNPDSFKGQPGTNRET